MLHGSTVRRASPVLVVCLLGSPLGAFPAETRPLPYPPSEVLTYSVEWRLITAGSARLSWTPKTGRASANLHMESTGLVSRLFKVNDDYSSEMGDNYCTDSTHMRASEGKRQREASATFDYGEKKSSYLERDLVKNAVVEQKQLDIPPCVHDVVAGLYRLRAMKVPVGEHVQIPMTDGKKLVSASVEAQEREQVKINKRTYNTIRYEAFLFNDVLYRRKGRLFIWMTDDDRRLPVQIRVRLQFYVGTITLQLEKEERS